MKKILFLLFIISACTQKTIQPNSASDFKFNILLDRAPATAGPNSSALQQCAQDLCGDPKNFLPLQGQGAIKDIVPKNVQDFLDNSVNPVLSKLFESNRLTLETQLNLAEKLMPKAQDSFFKEATAAYLILMGLMPNLKDIEDSLIASKEGIGFQISFEKARQKNPSYEPAAMQKVINIINGYLRLDSAKDADTVRKLSFDTYAEHIAVGISKEFAISTSARAIKMKLAAAQAVLGPYFIADLQISILDKAIAQESLTDFEKEEFMRLLQWQYAASGLLDLSLKAVVLSNQISVQEFMKLFKWNTQKENIKAYVKSDLSLQTAKKGLIEYCSERLVPAIAASPSNLRLRKSFELAKSVQKAAQSSLHKYYSGEALAKASKALSEIEFISPIGIESRPTKIVEDLEQLSKTLTDSNKMTLPLSEKIEEIQSFLAETLISMGKEPKIALTHKLRDFCDKQKPPHFEDKAFLKTGKIQMGWQTVLHPSYGAAIIAHEIGHIVSYATQGLPGNEQYTQTRQCLSDKHGSLARAEGLQDLGSLFDEEDWSDTFSATVMKELIKTWPHSKNLGCGLMTTATYSGNFENLEISDYSGLSKHSTTFYRALNAQIQLGKNLPKSCEVAFSKKTVEILQQKCGK